MIFSLIKKKKELHQIKTNFPSILTYQYMNHIQWITDTVHVFINIVTSRNTVKFSVILALRRAPIGSRLSWYFQYFGM